MASIIPCIDMAASADTFPVMEPRSSLPDSVTGRPTVSRPRSGTVGRQGYTARASRSVPSPPAMGALGAGAKGGPSKDIPGSGLPIQA
ncbi:hypothetical protein HDZ31DRAFT_34612 [Schizophyllum fasciatum]